jgi:hypothetical protein
MNDFLKSGFNLRNQTSVKSFLSDKRTVCIKHKDGHVTEHSGITDPWRYIIKVKKEPNIDDVWIKNE